MEDVGIRGVGIKARPKHTAHKHKEKEAAVSGDQQWPLGIPVTAGEYRHCGYGELLGWTWLHVNV